MSLFYNLIKILLSIALFAFFGALCAFIWLFVFCGDFSSANEQEILEEYSSAKFDEFLKFLDSDARGVEFSLKEGEIPEFLNTLFIYCVIKAEEENEAAKRKSGLIFKKFNTEIYSFIRPPKIKIIEKNVLKVSFQSTRTFAWKSFPVENWFIANLNSSPFSENVGGKFSIKRAGVNKAVFPSVFSQVLLKSFAKDYRKAIPEIENLFVRLGEISSISADEKCIIFKK